MDQQNTWSIVKMESPCVSLKHVHSIAVLFHGQSKDATKCTCCVMNIKSFNKLLCIEYQAVQKVDIPHH